MRPFAAEFGIASVDITPPVSVRIRNWGASLHPVATGVHRPLRADALYVRAGDQETVLVSLDLGWWRSPAHELRLRSPVRDALALPEENLWLHLTHTHSGPSLDLDESDAPGCEVRDRWFADLPGRVIQAAQAARRQAVPGRLEWTETTAPIAVNRDVQEHPGGRYLVGVNAAASVDRTVTVGRITARSGALIGVLMHTACHPTTLAWRNALLSPDYPGAARTTVEEAMGSPSMFLNGAAGDQGPAVGFADDIGQTDAVGRSLGWAVLSALHAMPPPGTRYVRTGVMPSGAPLEVGRFAPVEAETDLSARRFTVPLALQPVIPEPGDDAASRERFARAAQLRESVASQDPFSLPIGIWRWGDRSLVALPAEASSPLQAALRPARALILNITNGWYGYLPEAWAYESDVYAVRASPFASGCAEQVRAILCGTLVK
jgi:hypothetical protein